MRRNLPVDALGDLLTQPLLAVLATYRRDGSVLLSPVWHEWRDGGFSVVTSSDGIKAKHLRREPRTTMVVCEQVPPYRRIELRASARLISGEVEAAVLRIATRYLGSPGGESYAKDAGDDLLIRLEPGTLRTWDFVDQFDAPA